MSSGSNASAALRGHGRRQERGRKPCQDGAGGGNRTLIASLEGWSSTIELHPRLRQLQLWRCVVSRRRGLREIGGGGWIRTNVGVRQRIYSPPPLTTRASTLFLLHYALIQNIYKSNAFSIRFINTLNIRLYQLQQRCYQLVRH